MVLVVNDWLMISKVRGEKCQTFYVDPWQRIQPSFYDVMGG